jgi:hypothetical protein
MSLNSKMLPSSPCLEAQVFILSLTVEWPRTPCTLGISWQTWQSQPGLQDKVWARGFHARVITQTNRQSEGWSSSNYLSILGNLEIFFLLLSLY